MTAVYAPPNARRRISFWERIDEVRFEHLWLIIGDFNCVLLNEERSSKQEASMSFQDWVSRNGLIDLGYVGVVFTWSHGESTATRWAARLDRALFDDPWRRLFPTALVRHLTHSHSDHCPLLWELEDGGSGNLGRRTFKFEEAWTNSAEFDFLMQQE